MPIDFTPYHAVLLDLDGTLCHEDHALPGAVEVVTRFQNENRKFAILSNSCDSPLRVMQRLENMGLDVDPDVIYTAAAAACDYVLQTFATNPETRKPRVFNLATESVHDMLEGMVEWVVDQTQHCDAIICGAPANAHATEERRRTALVLARHGAAIVGCCADRVYPSPRGIEFGSGAMTWMLSYAANVEPIFCGKPEKLFFQELCHRIQVAPEMCILVGDNLEADIHGAKGVNMRTILSLSGVTRAADIEQLTDEQRPDLLIQDLRELI
jgi:HAD superfamily hydrolase (TIGR01450 family)